MLHRAQPPRVKTWDLYLLDSKPGWGEDMGNSQLWYFGDLSGKGIVLV